VIDPGLPLTEPDGGQALVGAATWWQTLATGTVATVIATIAVAVIGMLMLQGRLPLRRGVTVVLGCFLLFGARTISDGLLNVSRRATGEMVTVQVPIPPAPVATAPPQPSVYDPYAGAAVPVR
jgi:type IV secretory pathway VirB2 component (pilin)